MFYLSSIPRSGSSLLSSLLNQRQDAHATTTSDLPDAVGCAMEMWASRNPASIKPPYSDGFSTLVSALISTRQSESKKKFVFDKGRDWVVPQYMGVVKSLTGDMKVVVTVRPIAECIASFYEISKTMLSPKQFCSGQLVNHVLQTYRNLKAGYEAFPDNILFVEYDDLVTDTQAQMDRISEFTGMPLFKHDLDNVPACTEDDAVWGIKDLHKVSKKVFKPNFSAKKILGNKLYNFYQGGEFWNDQPEPVKEKKPIDLSLETAIRGEHDKSYRILKQEEKADPTDDRVAFNLGWHEMERGNLLAGHKLLNRGRNENVFGSRDINSNKPKWNGERGVTVLMNLEGGLGDQIHAIRYAKNIASYGNKVVVSGEASLAPILKDCEGVSAFSQAEYALGIWHDYWLPAMSATVPLNLEYSDLSGDPYIKRTRASDGKVGIKWAGNPEFEHEQHRVFSEELMFDAVGNANCISLQKDGEVPDWMGKPSLESWEDTRDAISRCDLVISSCTSVAHLSAAMGIETWIVVPILPYYLWALPGDTTQYYDSVKLFRQTEYGCWKKPFQDIKQELLRRKISKFTYGESTKSFIEA